MRRFVPALLLLATSCARERPQPIRAAEPLPIAGRPARPPMPPLTISDVFPPAAESGVSFLFGFTQISAVQISGDGFTRTTSVTLDDRPVRTEYQSRHVVVGLVPVSLLVKPRRAAIAVRDAGPPQRRCAPASFLILPKRAPGACPRPERLSPPAARTATAFNPDADGSSALLVLGRDFGPLSVVTLDGTPLRTGYRGPLTIIGFVPPPMLTRARTARLTVVDPGCRGKPIGGLKFEILP